MCNRLLHKSIYDSRYTQVTYTPIRFWYFYPFNRFWTILLISNLFLDFIKVFRKVFIKFFDFHAIDSRCTFIFLYPLFGYFKVFIT